MYIYKNEISKDLLKEGKWYKRSWNHQPSFGFHDVFMINKINEHGVHVDTLYRIYSDRVAIHTNRLIWFEGHSIDTILTDVQVFDENGLIERLIKQDNYELYHNKPYVHTSDLDKLSVTCTSRFKKLLFFFKNLFNKK